MSKPMKRRFVLYRRKRGGMFYLEDTQLKKQESLHTKNRTDAVSVLHARNESMRQPQINLQIAKAYLSGTDSGVTTRTWHSAIEALTNTKQGENKERWLRVAKDRALVTLLPQIIIETKGETLLKVLQTGTISTNVFLRRLHNFCVDRHDATTLMASGDSSAPRDAYKRLLWLTHCCSSLKWRENQEKQVGKESLPKKLMTNLHPFEKPIGIVITR